MTVGSTIKVVYQPTTIKVETPLQCNNSLSVITALNFAISIRGRNGLEHFAVALHLTVTIYITRKTTANTGDNKLFDISCRYNSKPDTTMIM